VITTRNGRPTLMLRFANGRLSIMTSANVRMFVLLEEHTTEGESFRRIHDLKLVQSHLPVFVMPWTVLHVIDKASPLHELDAEGLVAAGARIIVTVEARDQTLSALVQDVKNYPADTIRFGMHFAEAVTLDGAGSATADLSRISLLDPDVVGP
jgi:inward rectifier potassium channel